MLYLEHSSPFHITIADFCDPSHSPPISHRTDKPIIPTNNVRTAIRHLTDPTLTIVAFDARPHLFRKISTLLHTLSNLPTIVTSYNTVISSVRFLLQFYRFLDTGELDLYEVSNFPLVCEFVSGFLFSDTHSHVPARNCIHIVHISLDAWAPIVARITHDILPAVSTVIFLRNTFQTTPFTILFHATTYSFTLSNNTSQSALAETVRALSHALRIFIHNHKFCSAILENTHVSELTIDNNIYRHHFPALAHITLSCQNPIIDASHSPRISHVHAREDLVEDQFFSLTTPLESLESVLTAIPSIAALPDITGQYAIPRAILEPAITLHAPHLLPWLNPPIHWTSRIHAAFGDSVSLLFAAFLLASDRATLSFFDPLVITRIFHSFVFDPSVSVWSSASY